ncbi:MAG: GTP-binding protein [Candidatus Fimisoma sp.]|nr:GTP-binding protein [Candidatus Fimisoma sp.]
MSTREIPVYLFTGFLDAGKTTFIQETLEDPQFNGGEKTLVILCEEGETELQPLKFASSNVKIVTVEEEEQLTPQFLAGLEKQYGFERAVIEYNGMWLLDNLYGALPQNWVVYQEMAFADARTFLTYNNNMRNLTVDKMKSPEAIVFKYFDSSMDKMEYHKVVRVINRRCQILYEYSKDEVELDNIEDPLPYDINADVIEISDKDYAIWYTDMNEDEAKYYNKTIKVKGRTLLGGGLDDDEFVIGRHIMTCCVEDIQFGGLVAKWPEARSLEHGGWVVMTAVVRKEFNHMYQSEGPVFDVMNVEKVTTPEEEVATFY